MSKSNPTKKSLTNAPVVGIAIPCIGLRNKNLINIGINDISIAYKEGSGGVISIELKLDEITIIKEGEKIEKDQVFIGIKDGKIKGRPEGLAVIMRNLIKDELRPAETEISFKFGALKVGPGSGEKVGPGSGF